VTKEFVTKRDKLQVAGNRLQETGNRKQETGRSPQKTAQPSTLKNKEFYICKYRVSNADVSIYPNECIDTPLGA
jgi:hypothetical protein